ncbi:metal-dependent hydrolase family protein [Castellaniella sp. S9]|uniref:metal-dependent hydrolase family protein n=1 Tax=Castellaniella sp. S9 TaxID=2993652 RepID=UPI0022B4AFA0|nr:amidohydrolase family protein [Castellaniella sp. S9]
MKGTLKINNVTAWNGADSLVSYASLGIRDGRFTDPEALPQGVPEIDASSLTILPGLINAHVHFCLDGTAGSVSNLIAEPHITTAYKACAAARATLEAGTTTVRDVGCNGGIGIFLKRAIQHGLVEGPRMMASGPCIVMTGGHNRFIGTEIDGVDEARKAARRNLKMGADLIKVVATGGVITPMVEPEHVQLSMEEMRAAVDEAHNCGRRAASHAQGKQGIHNSLKAGVDTIEHGIYLSPDLIDEMLKAKTALVPTLTPMRRILDADARAGIPEYAIQKMRRVSRQWVDSFAAAAAAGVPIVAGTDAGTPGNPHGSVAVEIKFMVEAGIAPLIALRSATTAAAEAIGMAEEVGRIANGLWADLVFIKGNPLLDINALDHLCGVMKGGEFVWFDKARQF